MKDARAAVAALHDDKCADQGYTAKTGNQTKLYPAITVKTGIQTKTVPGIGYIEITTYNKASTLQPIILRERSWHLRDVRHRLFLLQVYQGS